MHLSRITRLTTVLAAAALLASGCGKKKDDDGKAQAPTPAPAGGGDTAQPGPGGGDTTDLATMVGELAAKIGVEPGGLEPEADQGAEAALTARTGTVGVRRAGEDEFADAPAGDVELNAGDQVRTGPESTATLVLADESTVELAEDSAIAIGDPAATPDPASSVAVLAGVARFTVSPRGPGEGAFMVHAPGGLVAAKGTVFAVGVAATGVARVGVEEGEVEVAGRADLAAPVVVAPAGAATVSLDGKVEGGTQFAADDWGEWRDGAEAGSEPQAVVQTQVDWLAQLEPMTADAYVELEGLSGSVATETATAEQAEQANDPAAYEAVAEPLAADVEATYLASLRLQNLTFAMLSSAYLAAEINARFPEQTEPVIIRARPRMVGALLWHKKYHVVVHHHVRPLRVVYYVHHPVGRTRAVVVKHRVPAFYARVNLKPLDPVRVRGRFKVAVYTPPVIVKVSPRKRVWVTVPARGWQARVKARPFKARAAGGWYVRAAAPKARVLVGVKVKARPPRVFVNAPRSTVGKVNLKFGGGARVKVGAGGGVKVQTPGANIKVAPGVDVRGGIKVGPAGGVKVQTPTGNVKVGPAGGVRVQGPGGTVRVPPGGVGARTDVKVGPAGGVTVKVKEPGQKPQTVKVGAGGGVVVKGKAEGKAEDKTKVKVGPPAGGVKVKGEVKAKGGIKIGP